MGKFSVEGLSDRTINYFKKYLEVDENQEAILRFSIQLVGGVYISLNHQKN